jgi:hypothetical protein
MKGLLIRKSLICAILLFVAIPAFSGHSGNRNTTVLPGEELFMDSPVKKKKGAVKKPQSAKKAQKKQDVKKRKQKEDSKKAVKEFQKHALEIQSPEVRERMKQNKKDADANYKAKKKASAARTKRGAKKYGR